MNPELNPELNPEPKPELRTRAARHAALGDPARLAIVDELAHSDRSPLELRNLLGMDSNLLTHHLDTLEDVGLINRTRSSGDGRRRYVHLYREQLPEFVLGPALRPDSALFVCTRNSARSQLAAALWRTHVGTPAESAGTHPADEVHPGALAAATRAGIELEGYVPRSLASIQTLPSIVVTVCDQAHEALDTGSTWLHWSVQDPVPDGGEAAFDAVIAELSTRIGYIATSTASNQQTTRTHFA